MMLDDLMPIYDVVERHHILVRAPPTIVFRAIKSLDLSHSLVTRALLFARAVPALLVELVRSPRAALGEAHRRRAELRFADFERAGFRVIAERAPQELVIGVLGKFWAIRNAVCTDVSTAHFAAGPPPGYALAGWNFTVEAQRDGTSVLRTETRVWCATDVRAKFRAYWLLIRLGSGIIRWEILRAIRHEAERSPSNAG
jgi:hypothetical protein